jgi:glycosyltransferase involved in cell wall biosynthesis
MPLFSVIIPTYNRGELIYPTLDSVLAQTERDFELIVVDDGSTDATADALQKYAARTNDQRIKIIRRENGGTTAARNTGISQAGGKYVTLLDHDDLWFPWTLQTYRAVIEQFDYPAFCAGSIVNQSSGSIDFSSVTRQPLKIEEFKSLLWAFPDKFSGYPSTWAIRSDVLKSIGGFFPYNLGFEDIDLLLRICDSSRFVSVLEPIVAIRGIHESNLSSDRQVLWFAAGMKVVLDREKSGQYPGGAANAIQRRGVITAAIRALSLGCLRSGQTRAAWNLYRESFVWNLRIGRVKYILALPPLLLAAQLRKSLGR